MTDMPTASIAQRVVRIVVLAALLASAVLVPSGSVAAQGGVQTVEVWGIDNGDKTWRYLQSDVDGDLGSASAAALGLDDSTWTTKTLRWREIVGSQPAGHHGHKPATSAGAPRLTSLHADRTPERPHDSASVWRARRCV